jgi:hypothetical protein
MSRRTQENIVAVALLALFGGVIWLCQDFGPRARMIPLPLAIFGLILTAIQLVWQNVRSTDELHVDLIAVPARDGVGAHPALIEETKPAAAGGPSSREEAGALGIVAALLALMLLLGPIPAIFLFTGGYFLITRHYPLLAGVIYTAVFTVATYLLFFVALEIQPYHGILAPLVGY